ncbi:hypothetical protein DUNSADRAFT_6429 [Dunaliella salina]|uniref:Ubiquitin-like protease family profile domain-containing protein n=1 Tax=Dunaliella salina TaxID=3046 RepID=A0ABQ7H6U7_DUNSA|nr:hypothetical protein DUNSADRAFT_6429 [Dunaliella salina]|eukprot:KAF5842578.1 hypothetical protein DUNSADRAFT_6429 [Dunaliella salina]
MAPRDASPPPIGLAMYQLRTCAKHMHVCMQAYLFRALCGSMLLEPMKANQAQVAVFAINDSNDLHAPNSGFHWTVLAFERASGTFRHYDSASGCSSASAQAARRTVLATKDALGVPASSPDDIVEVQAMPRQQNGFDCGVFASCVTDMLCKWQVEGKGFEQQEPYMREGLCREVSGWRASVRKLIGELQ